MLPHFALGHAAGEYYTNVSGWSGFAFTPGCLEEFLHISSIVHVTTNGNGMLYKFPNDTADRISEFADPAAAAAQKLVFSQCKLPALERRGAFECIQDTAKPEAERRVFRETLAAEIEKFEKRTKRTFLEDLKIFNKKNADGSFALSDDAASEVKQVFSTALNLPKEFTLRFHADQKGNAISRPYLHGTVGRKDSVQVDIQFDLDSGEIRINGNETTLKDFRSDLKKWEMFEVSNKYSQEIYNWNEPASSAFHVPKAKKTEIMATFDAILDLKKGTTTDVRKEPSGRRNSHLSLFSSDGIHTSYTHKLDTVPGGFKQELKIERHEPPIKK